MAAANAAMVLAFLAALAFLPAIFVLAAVRRDERRRREPMTALLRAFIFGGSSGVILALFFTWLFQLGNPLRELDLPIGAAFFAIVIIAPLAEELAKGLGLGLTRRRIIDVEDGIIYGVALGLGFGATENFVYGIDALFNSDGGLPLATATLLIRAASSMMLHACATGLLGFGYAMMIHRDGVVIELLPYYLLAVVLHSAYNYLVFVHTVVGLFVAMFLVLTIFTVLRKRIRQLNSLPHGTL